MERVKREQETVYAVPEFLVETYVDYPDALYSYERFTPSEAVERLADAAKPKHTILRRATWRHREILEAGRAGSPAVWEEQQWWIDNAEIWQDHFLTASAETPGMVAYYPSHEKAAIGLKTKLRPGRYLAKFFAGVLSEKERARMAQWQESGSIESDYDNAKLYPLAFATKADEIEQVYVDGPHSCMSGSSGFNTDGIHPARAYAAGDLAIAYLSAADTEAVRARALCWPAKKLFGRVYPTPDSNIYPDNWKRDGFASQDDAQAMQDALRNRLLADGYQASGDYGAASFRGAKMRKIELDDGDCVVLPWLDGDWKVDDAGDHFVMSQDGDIDCAETNGRVEVDGGGTKCERCEDRIRHHESSYSVYSRAGSGGGRGEMTWCECCRDNSAFFCHGFEEYFDADVDNVEVDDHTYTVAYAEQNFTYSNRSKEYFSGDSVDMANGDTWSREEFEDDGFTCAIREDNYPLYDRHPEHSEICDECTDEEIAEWLGEGAPDAPAIPVSSNTGIPGSGKIEDETQIELEIAA